MLEGLGRMRVSRSFADERGDDALHAHEARALDEDRRVRRRAAERADEVLDGRESPPAGKLGDRARALGARRPERLDAALARIRTGLAMERRPLRADLAHVAEKQPARR